MKQNTRLKNAALPIIAATVLNKGVSILKNCPKILMNHMIKVLNDRYYLGVMSNCGHDYHYIHQGIRKLSSKDEKLDIVPRGPTG